jgi:hypothetical protein
LIFGQSYRTRYRALANGAARRVAILKYRSRAREVQYAHVPDAHCAVDIFTKWVTLKKLEEMLAFLSGGSSLGRERVELETGGQTGREATVTGRGARPT